MTQAYGNRKLVTSWQLNEPGGRDTLKWETRWHRYKATESPEAKNTIIACWKENTLVADRM